MLLPYKPWHLDVMRHVSGIIGECYPDALERLGERNLAYTVVSGDEKTTILGVVGAAPMIGRDNTAEVFVVVSGARDAHPRVFARSVRHILDFCRQHFAKIEAACPSSDERKCRFLEWLGFSPVPGSDANGAMLRWAMEGKA